MRLLSWFRPFPSTLAVFLLWPAPVPAQTPFSPAGAVPAAENPTPLQHFTAEQARQKMMDQLGISALRPGRGGSHPPNYDEAKANPFPELPDPLVMADGQRVTSARVWNTQRRPELVELFDREIYGRVPAHVPPVRWEVTAQTEETVAGVPVVHKTLVGHVDNRAYPLVQVNIGLSLMIPKAALVAGASGAGRRGRGVPVVMVYQPAPKAYARFVWPRDETAMKLTLARGWAFAEYDPTTVQADDAAGLTEGIIGLCNHGQTRKPDDWGSLRAWAWGAGRALDALQAEPAVDAHAVALEGHSRYGKATLVTMAYDPRFAVGFVSSSGEGGAKLHRRDYGEIVENVAAPGEFHWMAGNFLKYAGPLGWNDLPVDSHELIALAAPRPLFLSAGTQEAGDGWCDPHGMWMAESAAGPVYRLLHRQGLPESFPAVLTAQTVGDLAWRQHAGGHTPGPNWPTFLDFAARYVQPGLGKTAKPTGH